MTLIHVFLVYNYTGGLKVFQEEKKQKIVRSFAKGPGSFMSIVDHLNHMGSCITKFPLSLEAVSLRPSWIFKSSGMQKELEELPITVPLPPNMCPWINWGFEESSDSWQSFSAPGMCRDSLLTLVPSPRIKILPLRRMNGAWRNMILCQHTFTPSAENVFEGKK